MSAITLDEISLRKFETEAERMGLSLGEFLYEALKPANPANRASSPRYILPTYDMGLPSVDLTKALALAADIEDEEFVNKLNGFR